MNKPQKAGPLRRHLQRELGLFSAILLGLGSMIGTGLFVSIGLEAGAAGPGVLQPIGVAALWPPATD